MTATTTVPAWFQAQQEAAQQAYESLPMPSRKDQNWRFGNLKQLDFKGYEPEPSSHIEYSIPELPEGVVCVPFEEALENHSTP